jgi:hypothetical protein
MAKETIRISGTYAQPSNIIQSIKDCIKKGIGIVPLIGSGMSAASGIPAGLDYQAYLFYCLARVFGTDGTLNKDNKKVQWDPSTLRWPDYSEVPVYHNIKEAMYRWSQTMAKEIKPEEDNEQLFDIIKWQAIGAVADWRALLDLLSRLSLWKEVADNNNATREVVLKHPDNRIIDSFFVNLTKGKRPSSSHMFLAHISDILRIKIILTTNFDNLIESAFQSLIAPVAVFNVHRDSSLPDADFVRAQRSVIKMHGGHYGLRADFSLDNYPTTDNVEKFMAYFSFYHNKDYLPIYENQRNLLVMGVSPEAAKRTIALVCRAMVKLENFQVYWICYSKAGINRVRYEFEAMLYNLYRKGELDRTQIQNYMENGKFNTPQIANYLSTKLEIASVTDLSLFLLELYQSIFLSLPPAGVQFPSIWPLAPKPCIKTKNIFNEKKTELIVEIKNSFSKDKILYIYGENGVTSAASEAFSELSYEYHCAWIDLEESFELVDFSFAVMEAIARKTGVQPNVPAHSSNYSKIISKEIEKQFREVIKSSKRKIIFFINGRELQKEDSQKFEKNLILPKVKSVLLTCLKSKYVRYVLLGWPRVNSSNNCRSIIINEAIVEELKLTKILENERLKEPDRKKDFCRFMLSLSLVQHASYLSLMHSWPFLKAPYSLSIGKTKDNDLKRFDTAKSFLSILRNNYAIRDDDGHFVFMPSLIRKKISEHLENELAPLLADINFAKAESHQGIADWYMKQYRACGDIQAVIDSLYHRLHCFRSAMEISDEHNKKRFSITSLIEMELAIKLAYNTMFSSFHALTLIHSFKRIETEIDKTIRMINEKAPSVCKSDLTWLIYKARKISKELKRIQQRFFAFIGKTKIHFIKEHSYTVHNLNGWRELNLNEEKAKKCLAHVRGNLKRRNYDAAEQSFKEIFSEIRLPIEEIKNGSLETEPLRKTVRNWIDGIIDDSVKIVPLRKIKSIGYRKELAFSLAQDIYSFCVQVLRLYQMLQLYYAQIKRYTGKNDAANLINAEKIYISSTEIMRYIMDNDFLNYENALLRTNTGIMLSLMKRHHEAYRRYNEAYGYLNFGIRPDSPLEFAVIDLRRGETFLSQIEQKLYEIRGSDPGSSLTEGAKKLPEQLKTKVGMLYDAIAAIDRGEYRMKGNTINAWWHCWMYELQLNLCVEIAKVRTEVCNALDYKDGDKYDLFGHCRECEFCGKRFISNMERGLEIAGNDILRIARYLHHLLEFIHVVPINENLRYRFTDACEFGEKRLKQMLSPDRELFIEVNKYAKETQANLARAKLANLL